MKYLISLFLLIAQTIYAQSDTCNLFPVIYEDIDIQSGYVAGRWVQLNNTRADTFTVWAEEYVEINPESSFGVLDIHFFDCAELAMLGNADAIAWNSITLDILEGILVDIGDLSSKTCNDDGKPALLAGMNLIKFKVEFIQLTRGNIEANVMGRNLDIWNFFKILGDANAQEMIDICNEYISLLSEPCEGAGGTPLDIRLGGRLFRLDGSTRRLIEKHESMAQIFTL